MHLWGSVWDSPFPPPDGRDGRRGAQFELTSIRKPYKISAGGRFLCLGPPASPNADASSEIPCRAYTQLYFLSAVSVVSHCLSDLRQGCGSRNIASGASRTHSPVVVSMWGVLLQLIPLIGMRRRFATLRRALLERRHARPDARGSPGSRKRQPRIRRA